MSLQRSSSTVYVSTRSEAQQNEVESLLAPQILPQDMNVNYIPDQLADLGPIAGLLAARLHDRAQSWLVSGCHIDYLSSAIVRIA